MDCNLENAGLPHFGVDRFQHIADIGHFPVPGSAGLQVVQEHGGQLLLRQSVPRQSQNILSADVREVLHGIPEVMIHHIQGDQIHILGKGPQHVLGKEADGLDKGVRTPGRIDSKGGNHQHDDARFRHILRIVILFQHIKVEVTARRIAIVQGGFHVEVRTGSNPFPVVVGHLVVRVQYFYQKGFKLIDVGGRNVRGRNILRQFFFVLLSVICHDAAHERRRLFPDVAGLMGQHFVQEIQGQILLILRHVGGIFPQYGDVSTGILPTLAAAGGFNQAGELFRVAEAAHHSDVVADSPEFQLLHHLVVPEQGRAEAQWNRFLNALFVEMGRGFFRKIYGDAVFNHQVFEILQLRIDLYIAVALGGIHVVQLVQDDIESLFEGIEVNDFFILHSGALYAEIRIDEQQGFHGKVFQLQIPGGVIGCDMRNGRKGIPAEAVVGVIIMKIRNTLFLKWAAAVFTDVMHGGGAGDDTQIHRHSHLVQLIGHIHGNVMNTADMSQGVKWRNIDTDAHEFVDVLVANHFVHLGVFRIKTAGCNLHIAEQPKVLRRIEGKGFLFVYEYAAHQLEQVVPLLAEGVGIRRSRKMGEQLIPKERVAMLQPAVLRFRTAGMKVILPHSQNFRRVNPSGFIATVNQVVGHGFEQIPGPVYLILGQTLAMHVPSIQISAGNLVVQNICIVLTK